MTKSGAVFSSVQALSVPSVGPAFDVGVPHISVGPKLWLWLLLLAVVEMMM